MTASVEETSKEIAELPKHQRLALLKLLLDLDRSAEQDIEDEGDDEIRARVKAVDEGSAVGIPYEQIRKEMARREHQKAWAHRSVGIVDERLAASESNVPIREQSV